MLRLFFAFRWSCKNSNNMTDRNCLRKKKNDTTKYSLNKMIILIVSTLLLYNVKVPFRLINLNKFDNRFI